MTGTNLPERVLLGIAAFAVFVLVFFFVAAALVLGAIMVTVLLIRLWWFKRTLQREQQDSELTAEYTVIGRESASDPRLPGEARADTEPVAQRDEQGKQAGR